MDNSFTRTGREIKPAKIDVLGPSLSELYKKVKENLIEKEKLTHLFTDFDYSKVESRIMANYPDWNTSYLYYKLDMTGHFASKDYHYWRKHILGLEPKRKGHRKFGKRKGWRRYS